MATIITGDRSVFIIESTVKCKPEYATPLLKSIWPIIDKNIEEISNVYFIEQ